MSKLLKRQFLIDKPKKKPFFSVITVVKNNQKSVVKTINSIEKQKFKNFEYIIVDGGSKDETIKKIMLRKKKINILVSKKDKGIYDAMNKGVKLSKGKFFVFLNAGDIFTKKGLEIVYKKYLENPKVDFIFATVKRQYTKSSIIKSGYNVKRLLYNFDFATSHSSGFFMKKKSFQKVGNFNLKYKCSSDYDLYLRTILTHKMDGNFTKRSQLVGIVESGGFSSKISFIDHLFEETRIRIDNHQNIVLVTLIFVNALIKKIFKIL